MIKEGAKLVESTQDILDELNCLSVKTETQSEPKNEINAVEQSAENATLLKHLGYDAVDINTLCHRSGLTAEVVSAMLLTLELNGQISSLPGGWYQRIQPHLTKTN